MEHLECRIVGTAGPHVTAALLRLALARVRVCVCVCVLLPHVVG